MLEGLRLAEQMDPGDEPAELTQQVQIVELGRPASVALEHGEPKRPRVVQGVAVNAAGWDNRQFGRAELQCKRMFFENGSIAPASRAIKLGDHGFVIFNADLIDAVFIAVEREEATVTAQRQPLERLDDVLGLQACVGECLVVRDSSHSWQVVDFGGMNHTAKKSWIAIAACLLAACGSDEPAIDLVAFEADTVEWRAGRLERLKGPEGYLNLAGLFWLEEGRSRIGSAADNDIVFPGYAARYVGRLDVTKEGVVMTAEPGVDVRHGDAPVNSIAILDDTTDYPVTIRHRSFAWTIIKRDGRFALRLRDFDNPAIAAFPPIEYFPIDPAYRVEGTLRRFDEPRVLNVETVIEGLGYRPESPGRVAFEIDGEAYEIDAYNSGDQLFFVFGDATSGRETYPAGRFLYAAQPGPDGKTILDFNRAYNPPCAFNDFSTCPVAAPQNRMAVRVEAGEKYDARVHTTPDNKN